MAPIFGSLTENAFTCSNTIKMAMLYFVPYDLWKGIAIKIGWLMVT